MGMDVYGKQPISEVGSYFRNNVWWWRPLWNYCLTQYPELTEQVVDGHSNSGDGLDAAQALALGRALQADIDSGVAAQYEKEYREYLAALPQKECEYCNASGKRAWLPHTLNNDTDQIVITECNVCTGSGKVDDWATSYPFSVENVQEFSKFLVSCGGFSIW